MPKQKTHSGLKKRLKRTASGKLKRGSSYRSHLRTNRTTKQNRHLRKSTLVHESDQKRIKQQITNLK